MARTHDIGVNNNSNNNLGQAVNNGAQIYGSPTRLEAVKMAKIFQGLSWTAATHTYVCVCEHVSVCAAYLSLFLCAVAGPSYSMAQVAVNPIKLRN